MLKLITNSKFIKGNAIVGVSITLMDNGSQLFDGCILTQKKQKVEVAGTFSTQSMDEFDQQISKDLPLNLHIDGKGIIHKKMDTGTNDVKKMFPGADLANFYIDEHTFNSEITVKSIVRKEAVDALIKNLLQEGYTIHSIFLGPHSLFSLKDFIQAFPASISTRRHKYSIDETDGLSSIQIDGVGNEIQQVGSEQLMEYEIVPYLTALTFFINQSDKDAGNMSLPMLNWENFLYKKAFGYLRWGILGFFFVVLLINYFIFDSINSKITLLQTEAQSNNQMFSEIKSLSRELELKENMVLESGLSSQTRFSLLGDKIGSSVPKNIALTRMVFSPLEEQIREGEEILMEKKMVVVEGSARNSLELNEWLKRLREEEWIEKIDILKYEHDYNNKFGDFKIRIKIVA